MSIVDELTAIAQSLRIELLEPPQPELLKPIRAGIAPELPDLQIAEILEGAVDLTAVVDPLTAVTKDVQYSDQFPETPTSDQQSFQNLTTAGNVVGGMPTEALGATGIPGLLAQLGAVVTELTGHVPLLAVRTVPVSMKTKWIVMDENNKPLTLGRDFLAPAGLDGPTGSFLLLPEFLEQDPRPSPLSLRRLKALVILYAGGAQSTEVALPTIDINVPALALASMIAPRFKIELPKTSIPPAQPVSAQLLETQVANPFTKIRELVPGINIAFSYRLSGPPPSQPNQKQVATDSGSDFPSSGPMSVGSLLKFLMRPRLAALGASGDPWTLQIEASVSGLPGGRSAKVPLPPISLIQLPVEVPVVVLAFDGFHYTAGAGVARQQATYVFLPPGNPITNTVLHRKTVDAVKVIGTAQKLLGDQLGVLSQVLSAVAAIFPGFLTLDANSAAALTSVTAALANSAADEVIIDGTVQCDDLGTLRDVGWNDRISSLAVIGVPGSSRKLALYQNPPPNRGYRWEFGLPPDGHIIATFTSLEHWTTDSVPAGPYASGYENASNRVTSSRWEG